MSRSKADESARGKPVKLPPWWLEALRRLCGDRTHTQLAEELTAVTGRRPPFRREQIGDFLSGKVTTDIVMGAFLARFPELPSPVFYASSYEEAHQLQQVARRYSTEQLQAEKLKITETIEDVDDVQPAAEARDKRTTKRGR